MINVRKRNGQLEELDYQKIHDVLDWACDSLEDVSVSDIEMNSKMSLIDNIKTSDIHEVLIRSAHDLVSVRNPNYELVAARLLNQQIRKEVFQAKDTMPSIEDVANRNIAIGVYDEDLLSMFDDDDINYLNNEVIDHSRDFNFRYAGLRQLTEKYLAKNRKTGEIHETPQYMYLFIAMSLFADDDLSVRMDRIKDMYDAISLWKINLPTPIMAGVRTPDRQYSSCVLIDVGDDLESISASNSAIMRYIARRAGIGINIGKIRPKGASIRNGQAVHTGLVPYLKFYESSIKCCSQGGIRAGAATVYIPFWHLEIEDVIVLKNDKGNDENRVRKLDYAVQLSGLFYKRLQENSHITLFNPDQVQDLYEAFGDNEKFDALYVQYEAMDGIDKRKVNAEEFFIDLCKERIETARIYIQNIDHSNTHSSFVDSLKMSNLCTEVILPVEPFNDVNGDDGEVGVCVLLAVNMGIVEQDELTHICEIGVRALDRIVTIQDYPTAAAKRSTLKRRPLGIGVTNYAYFLAKKNLPYGSQEALDATHQYFERLSFECISSSVALATEIDACEGDTEFKHGRLPIDHYCKTVDSLSNTDLLCDWDSLREDCMKHGTRHSCLTAQMPCESSSAVTNSVNGIEMARDLLVVKGSKSLPITQLAPDSKRIGHQYSLAFDMPNNMPIIKTVAVMQKFIDQSISMNHYYDPSRREDGLILLSEVMNDVLYSYKYGIKTMYYANTRKLKDTQEESCAGGGCAI